MEHWEGHGPSVSNNHLANIKAKIVRTFEAMNDYQLLYILYLLSRASFASLLVLGQKHESASMEIWSYRRTEHQSFGDSS